MSLATTLSQLNSRASSLPPTSAPPMVAAAAMKEIEARFSASLLDSALPKGKSVFGKGLAGSIAREALVNRISQILSESGLLGIQSTHEKTEKMKQQAPVERPAAMPK